MSHERASGQSRLVDPRVAELSPTLQVWSFPTPLGSDSSAVSSMRQWTLPITASFTPVRGWRVDMSAAYANARVTTTTADGGNTELGLAGATDAKVRAVGRFFDERIWLTLGLNVPVGRSGLSEEEAGVIRVVGAPVFRARAPVLGSGFDAIAGIIYALPVGRWAVGLGISYELRATYTALEAALAGGLSATAELDPAEALHLSLALDRIVGQGRMSILFVADRYGDDIVTSRSSGSGAPVRSQYRLGPTLGASWEYQRASQRFRLFRLWANARHRLEFTDGSGARIAGSSGGGFDAGISATIGGARGPGFVIGGRGAFETGLDLDNTLATAALTAGTATVGLELRSSRFTLQPFVEGTIGSVDTGPATGPLRALAGGITLRTEW
jgi:hypothetical protein